MVCQRPKHPRRQNLEEKNKLGKSNNKIAQKGISANQLVKNSSKTLGRIKWDFTEGEAITTSREERSNSRSASKKNRTQKHSTLLQKLK